MQTQIADFERLSSQELLGMTKGAFDSLPFGAIKLDRKGVVREYNHWEAELARRKVASVIGKSFFRDIAPCTDVAAFRGRLDAIRPGDPGPHLIDFTFAFPWGHRAVRIRFLVESEDDRWVFVTDVT
jgi:photoactive yellow protein